MASIVASKAVKTEATPTDRAVHPRVQRSTLAAHPLGHGPLGQALFLQRAIGNRATMRLRTQQSQGLAERDRHAPAANQVVPPVRQELLDFNKDTSSFTNPSRSPSVSARSSDGIQAKLVIGRINDPLEHEADQVAEQVMRMPAPEVGPALTSAPLHISRKCEACEQEEERVRRKEAGTAEASLSEAPTSVHEALRSPGRPLDISTRAYFEPRFGQDGSVRVHTRAMFAPLSQNPKSAPSQPSAAKAQRPDRTVVDGEPPRLLSAGNQAVRRLQPWSAIRTNERGDSGHDNDIAVAPAKGVPAWEFGKIAIFSPGAVARAPGASWVAGHSFGRIQPKLEIGAIDDSLEQEADHIAHQVMRMPAPHDLTGAAPPRISRKCADCNAAQKLHLKSAGRKPAAGEAPATVHEVLHSSGQPLDATTLAYFEPRFGRDFSDVRVHTDDTAAQSARDMGALAYTVGYHMVFHAGQFLPETHAGRHLLAHELTHVIQQRGSGTRVQRDLPPLTASTDLSAIQARLDAIIRAGGPLPSDQTRVIGAAIVEIPGYTGPTEIRAISAAATDELGQGAPVHHAVTPDERTLSATRAIGGSGVRREFPFSHINDAEIKIFEEIAAHTPAGAKGRVHFLTMRSRVRNGVATLEPIPACSGCNRATFELAGGLPSVEVVTHAAAHPTGSYELGGGGGGVAEISPGAFESSAAAGQEATASAVEGAAVMIHQGQVQNLENYEHQKAEDAFKKIEPTVNRFTSQGQWVAVKFIFDAPKAPNLLSGVFKEQSDISHFLWVTYKTGDTKDEALGEEHQTYRQAPFDAADYEAPRKPLGADRTSIVAEVRVFAPDPNPHPTMMGHPAFVGNYSPFSVDQGSVGGRFDEMVATGMHRSLQFHAGSTAVPRSVVEMWHVASDGSKRRYETDQVSGNDPSKGISARFVEKADGKVFYTITSYFKHVENYFGGNFLGENVSGKSDTPNLDNWSALIVWKQNDNSG